MINIESKNELYKIRSEHSRFLVCFWKKGCPGCLMVSKLIRLLESGAVPVFGFDCSGGMDEAKSLGIDATPRWVLYENGENAAEITPSEDREVLYAFLTEQAGFSLLRPIFDMALDEGKAYAGQVQDAIAEMMFRSGDGNGILDAARLKILKACMEAPADRLTQCIDDRITHCEARLRERMKQEDDAAQARMAALESLPSLREELLRELTLRRNNEYKEKDI